jgi:hypothetical protein
MNGERQMLPVHTIRIRASSPMITPRSAGRDEQGGDVLFHGPDSICWRAGALRPTSQWTQLQRATCSVPRPPVASMRGRPWVAPEQP